MIDRVSHYRVVRLLGRGAMGEVYHAIDERLGRSVALKLLPSSISASPDSQARLLREAQAASALNHPGIVTVHDVGAWDGGVYMVMELVDGVRFSDCARQGLELAAALELVAEAADALGAAHARSIFHRDIKSDNLMRSRGGRAKVLDFGLAKLRDAVRGETPATSSGEVPRLDTEEAYASTIAPEVAAASEPCSIARDAAEPDEPSARPREPLAASASPAQTIAGSLLGTPAYMSPEQAAGQTIDATSEVFSLGIVLYELVTGALPFTGDSIESTIDAISHAPIVPPSRRTPLRKIPPFVDALVLRAIERDRTRRFADMATFADATRSACLRLVGRRSRVALSGGVAAVAMLVFGALLYRPHHIVVSPKLTTVKRITFESGCEEYPSFSADGRKIVYDGVFDGDYEVFALDVKSGTRTRLTSSAGWDYAASLSPDGHTLAWLHVTDDGPQLTVAAPDQGSPRSLGATHVVPGWTRDGALVVSFDGKRIEHLSVADGRRDVIGTLDGAVDLRQVAALSGGAVVALWRDSAATREIGVTRPGGKVDTLVQGIARGRASVAVAPSQRAFYYTRNGGNAYELIRHSLDDGAEISVPGGSTPVTFAIAPDGKRLVYSTCVQSHRIARIAPDQRISDLTSAGTTHDLSPRVVGKDGLGFVFGSDRAGTSQVWLRDGVTGELRALTSDGTRSPAVSHDGAFVAYVDTTQHGLFVVPLAGGAARRLTDDASDAAPAFSRDDATLVFERGRENPRIWSTTLDAPRPHPLSPDPGRAPATSPVADVVAYLSSGPAGAHLVFVRLDGKPARASIALPKGTFDSPAFSPDGSHVALLENTRRIVEVPLADGLLQQRWVTPIDGLQSVTYDVDGKSFVVSLTRWEGDLWLADGEFP